MTPILKYKGGKFKEIPYFINYVPKEFGNYIEPFFGGGALFFYLEPRNSIIGDINKRLIRFYKQIITDYDLIRKQLDELENIYHNNQRDFLREKNINNKQKVVNKNETLYCEMRKQFNSPGEKYLEAVIYYFINKTSYGSMTRYNKKGAFNVPFGRYANFNSKLLTIEHHNLLKKSKIINCDYNGLFDKTKNNDFIFLDPPYDCVFNDYGNINTNVAFNETEHRRLFNNFKNLSCKTLMILGETPFTRSLYKDYIVDVYKKRYSVNIKNRFDRDNKHMIIKNY